MTTITASSTLGIVLTSPAYVNPVVLDPGVTISSNGNGVYAHAAGWTLQNYGRIVGNTTVLNGKGIYLRAGGSIVNESAGSIIGYIGVYGYGSATSVINAGGISGSELGGAGRGIDFTVAGSVTNQNSGTITGFYGIIGLGNLDVSNAGSIAGSTSHTGGAGVELWGGGSVTNQGGGTITGSRGVYGFSVSNTVTVFNAGVIAANMTTFPNRGVDFNDGGSSLTNQSTASISGYEAVVGGGSEVVLNAGIITGNMIAEDGRGVGVSTGSHVTNQSGGTISGFDGIYGGGPVSVVNAGTAIGNSISVFGRGIVLDSGGSVTNQSSGSVSGAMGIYADGVMTVVNAGIIAGLGPDGFGVDLVAGGQVTNAATGMISASDNAAVYSKRGPGTVVNAGIISGGTFDVVYLQGGFTNRLVIDPGAGFVGKVDGGNTIGGTVVSSMELASGSSAGTLSGLGTQFIDFGAITIDAGADWLISGNTAGFAGTITGFAAGDMIEVNGITATGSSFSGGVLTLTEATGSATLNLSGSFTTSEFTVTNVAGGADVSVACFRAGTHIRTARGELPVEHLRIGGDVTAFLGAQSAPILWIGRRTIDCRRHPKPMQVWPVRIATGAFGAVSPCRDLFLSPDHAVYVGEVLIPIKCLINGTTIVQVPVDDITYYHVELPQHDVLLAEGLPVESSLHAGHRSNFANEDGAMWLFPDFSTPVLDPGTVWEAQACAPLVVRGAELDAVREMLKRVAPGVGEMIRVVQGGKFADQVVATKLGRGGR